MGTFLSRTFTHDQTLILTTAISVVLALPIGFLTAISNGGIGLNVISEFIGGLIVPGKALAMNMFKAYGCLTLAQALGFVSDLKLGHYTKIPPKAMFRAQMIGTFGSIFIVLPR